MFIKNFRDSWSRVDSNFFIHYTWLVWFHKAFDFMIKDIIIFFIQLYQKFLSPLKLPSCRFFPTCSTYAIQSLENYGFFKGIGLSILRVLRCHPFHPGGYDPVSHKNDK